MDKSDLAYRLEKIGFSYNDYATILESDVTPVNPVSYTLFPTSRWMRCMRRPIERTDE